MIYPPTGHVVVEAELEAEGAGKQQGRGAGHQRRLDVSTILPQAIVTCSCF
eukprot:COSAG04_NODE_1_length_58448_cov_23.476478_21_plen_51_part_00